MEQTELSRDIQKDAGTENAHQTSGYSRADTIKMMKESIDVMAAICLPEVCTEFFPDEYQYLWKAYTERLLREDKDFSQQGLALPRGHGKTMFIKLLTIFCVLFTSRRYILIVCANDELAEAITTDVASILDSSNIATLFGNWRTAQKRDKIGYLTFNFMGYDRILRGLGQGSSFRGTNIDNQRPDVMIFDDAQTKDCAESPATSKKFIEKFFGTMLKAKSPRRCFYLYVGNMYPNVVIPDAGGAARKLYACLLRNLKDNPSWETVIVGGLLESGEALWESLQSREQLLKEFVNDFYGGSAHVFAAEVLNDPDFSLLGYFDPSKVPDFPFGEKEEPWGKFIMIDPSVGRKTSDAQAVGLFYLFDGRPVLREMRIFQTSAPTMVQEVMIWAKAENVPLIAVENYAYQGTLMQWLNFWMYQTGMQGTQVVPITRGGESKNSSIITMFKELMEGELFLHPDAKADVYDQIIEFRPEKSENTDDILDVCAYANKVYLRYERDCVCALINGDFDNESSGVIDAGLYYG